MITLFLLRHAHAGDAGHWHRDDDLRPLSEKGRRQSERLARLLAATADAPDLFVTSPRTRASETAGIVGGALGARVVVDDRLAGPLDAGTVTDILGAAGRAERPCLVGHDPELSDLLGELLGLDGPLPMRKGAIARVDVADDVIEAGAGTLRYLVPPEILPDR